MKKIYNFIFLLTLLTVSIISCSNGGEDAFNQDGDDDVNQANQAYAGTKWSINYSDISVGDDYIGTQRGTLQVYFYSNTEGVLYVGDHSDYSDVGLSASYEAAFFRYEVNNEYEYINLDFITDPFGDMPGALTIQDGKLYWNSTALNKEDISSSDKTWLNTISGTTGECNWYYDLRSTLYVVGEGAMADYTSANRTPWGTIGFNNIVVDEGVTHIGNFSFDSMTIGDVELPRSSLTSIGKYAFTNTVISDIDMPNSVTEIGDCAYANCSYLTKAYLPKNLLNVGDYAFANCSKAEVNFSSAESVKTIGEGAFMNVKSIKNLNSTSLEEVGMIALSNITDLHITLPDTYTTLNSASFSGKMTTITIGQGLKTVVGTPFYPSKTGKMYVNLGVPLDLKYDIIDSEVIGNWTLYVPKGSVTAYKSSNYWKNFKSIEEDTTLVSGNGKPDYGIAKNPQTYSINGVEYKMILLKCSNGKTIRMMQTELPSSAELVIGSYNFGKLNSNGDKALIKAEFRNFLSTLRDVTGTPFRLPTKEEWQYAASGGNKSKGYKYSGSNTIDDVAWYKDNSYQMAHSIALKNANEMGFYDMSGNYAEVCNETEDVYYVDGPICGGSWNDSSGNCMATSWKEGSISGKIPGSTFKEKNAFDARYNTVRLVYTVSE